MLKWWRQFGFSFLENNIVATLILKEGREGEDSHSRNGSLGVHWDSQTFKEWLQGSKHLALRSSLYHWKTIEVKMSKMGSHDPFGHLQHKLLQKERRESNWQFDSRPQKVGIQPDPHLCKWSATHHWKGFEEKHNIVSDLILIGGLSAEL
jgi:hypothetical protein